MKNELPYTVNELFNVKEYQYRYFSENSMDNNTSMQWFVDYVGLSEYIVENYGTQIIIKHPDYEDALQIDAGGLGDFFSHKFDVSIATT